MNAGTASADVGGWKVVYRSTAGTTDTSLATIPDGTTIAAGGFYLVGGSAYAGARATNALVEGTAAAAPPATASPGSSIVRKPDGRDTNDNAADLTISSTATPGATNG